MKKKLHKIKPKLQVNQEKLVEPAEELYKKFHINFSEEIVNYLVQKIITNSIVEINNKKIDSLLNLYCFNHTFNQINNLLSQKYLCYDTDVPLNIKFHDNFIRNHENNYIAQPKGGVLDRWKIYQGNVNHSKNENIEKNEVQSITVRSNSIDKKNTYKYPDIQRNENLRKEEKNKDIEIKKPKKFLKVDDSLYPSFPLNEKLFIKKKYPENLEKEIETYRQNILEKGKQIFELKNKMEQNKDNKTKKINIQNNKIIQKLVNVNKQNVIKKKKINYDFIYKIRKINPEDLKSEFISALSKIKVEGNRRKTLKSQNIINLIEDIKRNVKVEKDVTVNNEYNSKLLDKIKQNQPVIISGSSFKNFVPEVGVTLNQNGSVKSGGIDFLKKYNKLSIDEFSKTLEYFKHAYVKENINNITKNEKEKEIIKNKLSNINSNNNSKIINSINQRSLIKSSSLSDFNQSNSFNNNESNNINNLNLYLGSNKNSFYKTNFNNSLNIGLETTKSNKFMKSSSSLKLLFSPLEEDININNGNQTIRNKLSQRFFQKFNLINIKNSHNKNNNNSFEKIQDFNINILKNNNWGTFYAKNKNYNYYSNKKPKMGKSNVFVKSFYKPFRVRNNTNEQYFTKMNVINQISLRSQSNPVIQFKNK